MASIGTNLGNAINDVIKWLAAAVKKIGELISAGDTANAVLLVADTQAVIKSYLDVVNQYIPTGAPTPLPKNWLSKLTWLGNNFSWMELLFTLLTGTNPFNAVKANAATIAAKWGLVV
jgi:hypothetical protein